MREMECGEQREKGIYINGSLKMKNKEQAQDQLSKREMSELQNEREEEMHSTCLKRNGKEDRNTRAKN